jgi:hypothetical protein
LKNKGNVFTSFGSNQREHEWLATWFDQPGRSGMKGTAHRANTPYKVAGAFFFVGYPSFTFEWTSIGWSSEWSMNIVLIER